MAKKRQQNGHQQQLVVILMTICLIVVSLLTRLDSVSALSISLNGNGNLLQQQTHDDDNGCDHNYVMDQQQRNTTSHSSSIEVLEYQGDDRLNNNNGRGDLAKSQLIFDQPFQQLTLVKRATGGFIGMRGKKDSHEDKSYENNDNSITFPWEQIQNSDEEEMHWDDYAKPNGRRYKKTPTAFYGVRGKKFAGGNGVNPSNDNQRWQDFLQKLEEDRVRDIMLQEFFERITGPNDLTVEMAKRAPTGFTGMRGKRPSLEVMDASSMESMTKRGLGNNAFVGVRGKKDVSHQTFKRSPKSESSSVGGAKRQRFTDFGNKFVAVRGKKSFYELNDNMATPYNNNLLPSSATVHVLYANSDKRTPSGFLGMRGKRPFTSDEA